MILVSACLAGFPCRWDGSAVPDSRVMELVKSGQALPVCPEQLGGLPTPRPPAERCGNRVLTRDGFDVTEQFKRGAAIVLAIAREYDCSKAILKSCSPSCGKARIHDGSFTGKLTQGNGITAGLLMKDGIEVITEEEIANNQ